MQTETNNQPQLLIIGGGTRYQVTLDHLSQFLNTCKDKLLIGSTSEIEDQLQDIIEFVIDGTPDDKVSSGLKRQLIFLRELDLLFKGMLYAQ